MSDHVELLQAVSFSCCAAKAAGARRRARDVASAAAFLQFHKRPAHAQYNTVRNKEDQLEVAVKTSVFLYN